MGETVLLYGATGYSGRLIAAEAAAVRDAPDGPRWRGRVILAARDPRELAPLAAQHGMESRAFVLDDTPAVARALADVDVVLNAAGPFALTADRLANAAVEAGVHYVDINGEADVFLRLDDLNRKAGRRRCAIVCSAGCTAAASNFLLEYALRKLARDPVYGTTKTFGAVRIAMTRPVGFSRGSVETAWRSLREQVTIVRRAANAGRAGDPRRALKLVHVPVGQLERTFDFAHRARRGAKGNADRRIASATDLVDTLVARKTCEGHGITPDAIESYVDMGVGGRVAYQLGALFAPVAALPLVRALANAQIEFLPPGPDPGERSGDRHVVLLEIEDVFRTCVTDLRLETPSPYQFTAQIAVAVAVTLALAPRDDADGLCGLQTPAAILGRDGVDPDLLRRAARDCELVDRLAQ